MKKAIILLMIAFVLGSFNVYAIIGPCPDNCGCYDSNTCKKKIGVCKDGDNNIGGICYSEADCNNPYHCTGLSCNQGPDCSSGYSCSSNSCNPICGDSICKPSENCDADKLSCDEPAVCYERTCADGCNNPPLPMVDGTQDSEGSNICDAYSGCDYPPCQCDGSGICESIRTPCDPDDFSGSGCCDNTNADYFPGVNVVNPISYFDLGSCGGGSCYSLPGDYAAGSCCGDDLSEYYNANLLADWLGSCYGNDCIALETDNTFNACCDLEHDCVYEINGNAECFAPGEVIDLDTDDGIIDGVCVSSDVHMPCEIDENNNIVGNTPCDCGEISCSGSYVSDECYPSFSTCSRVVWEFNLGSSTSSSPSIASDGTIYISAENGNLYAVNPDGTEKWFFSTGGMIISSSPAIGSDGTIYIGSDDGNLYAIDSDGSLKWVYLIGTYISSSPAIGSDGTIYIGSDNDNLYAINPDGSQKWIFTASSWISSSPAIAPDGTIYINSDNILYAIYPNGNLKWTYGAGDYIGSSPAIGSDGTIYIGSDDKYLHAINPDGSQKWSYITVGEFYRSSPAIGSDGTIYFGTGNIGRIYSVDLAGNENWVRGTSAEINSAPVIGDDGTVYIININGRLYSINSDNSLNWQLDIYGVTGSSPAIDDEGRLYVGGGNKLYSILTGSTGLAESSWPKFRQNIQNTGQQP